MERLRDRYKRIDASIIEGLAHIEVGNALDGCKIWLEAWEEIKALLTEGVAEDVFDLNTKHRWKLPISNYVQFLEMELHNAGIDDAQYHQKRVSFCRELIQWCKDDLTIKNTRMGMTEAYFGMDDFASGDQIFIEWLRDDPDCGMGYAGWADCYRMTNREGRHDRAEEILLDGYARSGLRDRHYVAEGLFNLYNETGNQDKAKEYGAICSELRAVMSNGIAKEEKALPVKVAKTGRNEPCPCGSGKKYKKCCGA